MEFVGSKGEFGAGWLCHGRAIGLTQFVGLKTVLVKEKQVDGIVDHNDADVVDIT